MSSGDLGHFLPKVIVGKARRLHETSRCCRVISGSVSCISLRSPAGSNVSLNFTVASNDLSCIGVRLDLLLSLRVRSDIDCFASSDDKLPSRELCPRDFINLEHLCQVFPDDEFDFDDLLQITDKQCKESVNGSLYMDVVKEFKRFR